MLLNLGALFAFKGLFGTGNLVSFANVNIPEPGNRESGETETAIPVKRKP